MLIDGFRALTSNRTAVATVLSLLVVCAFPEAAVAQDLDSSGSEGWSDWSVQVEAGPSFPLAPSPFSNHYGTGVSAGLQASASLTSSVRLEAVARYQRSTPPSRSDVKALVGATEAAAIDGADVTLIAGGAGARYEVSVLTSVRVHGALRVGAVQSRRGSVEDASGDEVFGGVSEIVPWVEAAVGAAYPVSKRLSVLVGPAVTAALTTERATYSLSARAGLQLDL
jgi:hypothetical protein